MPRRRAICPFEAPSATSPSVDLARGERLVEPGRRVGLFGTDHGRVGALARRGQTKAGDAGEPRRQPIGELGADTELLTDYLVGASVDQADEHFALPRRQLGQASTG